METEQYTIYQRLLNDPTFVSWVKSDFVENDSVWSQFIDEHDEHTDEINAAIRLVQSFQTNKLPVIDNQVLWQRIRKTTGLQTHSGVSPLTLILTNKRTWLAAASIVLLMIAFWSLPGGKTVATDPGEDMTTELPDGSTVRLGAGSTLKYDPSEWASDRRIHLKGFAFFDVIKGSRFQVHTKNGIVTVLGTSFSVQDRPGQYEVICRTGKVRVETETGDTLSLIPGQKARIEAATGVLTRGQTMEGLADVPWLDGIFTFENVGLREVADEIQYQFDVEIVLDPSLENRKYTGFFSNSQLEKALQSVFWPLNLQYTIEKHKVTVRPK